MTSDEMATPKDSVIVLVGCYVIEDNGTILKTTDLSVSLSIANNNKHMLLHWHPIQIVHQQSQLEIIIISYFSENIISVTLIFRQKQFIDDLKTSYKKIYVKNNYNKQFENVSNNQLIYNVLKNYMILKKQNIKSNFKDFTSQDLTNDKTQITVISVSKDGVKNEQQILDNKLIQYKNVGDLILHPLTNDCINNNLDFYNRCFPQDNSNYYFMISQT